MDNLPSLSDLSGDQTGLDNGYERALAILASIDGGHTIYHNNTLRFGTFYIQIAIPVRLKYLPFPNRSTLSNFS